MKTYSYPISEFNESLKRAFVGAPSGMYLIMDGQGARSKFLRESWNYFVEEKLIRTESVEEEQDSFIKGYITDKGKQLIRSL